jgi:hypothetical protein
MDATPASTLRQRRRKTTGDDFWGDEEHMKDQITTSGIPRPKPKPRQPPSDVFDDTYVLLHGLALFALMMMKSKIS